ncbi:hypothetical protein [Methanosarcina acetivorans]|uniref:Lipoprotein n=1 Tax=Methanosarcina acetivorans (strain ATCC 35395 / DSM 2834 / JCM 12185 / C2A) TaxID=188937 RepID=Q8TNG0_METAC|nr:hypothetical protein [Methanosarcina acetivorans]AAM05718.1 conserved hypothetical protein [Methanosarcina acetivorans C2A]
MRSIGKLVRGNTTPKIWRLLFVVGLIIAVSLFAGCASTPEEGETNATTSQAVGEPSSSSVQSKSASLFQKSCPDCKCPDVLDDKNNTEQVHFDDLRDYRYAEILLSCPDAGTGIFNTIGLNIRENPRDSLPADLFANFSETDVEEHYDSSMVWMNGPSNWTMDAMDVLIAIRVRNLDGLDTRWGADIVVPEGANLSEAENVYMAMPVQCNRTWHFDKGKPVFILEDSNNNTTYVMQSYCQIIDKNLTYEDLQTLDTRLELPPGWSYRVEVLPEDLEMNGIGTNGTDWQVTQDSLQNTYSACLERNGEKTCNYHP